MSKKTAAYVPALSERITGILKTIVNSRVLPSGLVKRAMIILLASQRETNQEISKEMGSHYYVESRAEFFQDPSHRIHFVYTLRNIVPE